MIRRSAIPLLVVLLAGCGNNSPPAAPVPADAERTATPALLDSLWSQTRSAVARKKWDDVIRIVTRFSLEAPVADPRATQARLYLGEAYLGKKEFLQAAREFRRVSDENPADPLAPQGLLLVGDAYRGLWRRPELDPTYGQAAIATYEELLSRYPGTDAATQAQLRISELQERFAYKQLKAAQYYLRLKAYDSAILYLKDLAAKYPRAQVTPGALVMLIDAYRALNYQEDVQETCQYLLKYHPGNGVGRKSCAGVAPPQAPGAAADSTASPAGTPATQPAQPAVPPT
ncbi:MAG: outer membrane protein assembly factor BamD [Gemmatimonadales bacterium]|nr:outer membrane protein assembly factor BamD [Gemmatimonadales bacterium]